MYVHSRVLSPSLPVLEDVVYQSDDQGWFVCH